ncbi:hypothetical protein R1T16_06225 [Flavobacterium sp. DG1-102-2]|uniref:hypothetical protein n=1 Tax=Flavobacterium sp. DG1-102-2 TaxID=3081663 RepID=UPI00294A0388|nr:hypothetical protein [Flavobacterium sp. DG1-102-2]MDV6168013.1 hypothetical protein [Flavobacterium sp. DG1-102-2]
MHKLFTLLCFIVAITVQAQPNLELTSRGFEPVEAEVPSTPNEKLITTSENWAREFNRRQKGVDITGVTANSMSISAFKKNAFFIRSKGEMYEYTIHYTIKLKFNVSSYTLQFNVNDIYTDADKLVKYKLPDYFTSDGSLKEGYSELKPSLERTVNEIVTSHYNYLINFR